MHGTRVGVALDTVVAARTVPAGETSPKQVQSFVLGLSARTSHAFQIGLRVPVVFAQLPPRSPDPARVSALGNIEIAPRFGAEVAKATRLDFEMGLSLPTASGDDFGKTDATRHRALALSTASASRGLEDPQLFARHRMGFIPRFLLSQHRGAFEVGANIAFPLLQRAGGQIVPDNYYKNAMQADAVVALSVYYWAVPRTFAVGLRAIENLSLEGDVHKQGVSGTDDRGRLTIEPSLKAQLGPARVAAGFLIPVSGPQSDLAIYGGRLVVGGHF